MKKAAFRIDKRPVLIYFIWIERFKIQGSWLKTTTRMHPNINYLNSLRYTMSTKYTYDPEAGDYERNSPPGTPFEDLPDDWCCPECGAEKEFFEELDD